MGLRVILNGKKAGLEPVRAAIYSARETGRIDVRVTWEAGDVGRMVREACAEGCRRLVAGGVGLCTGIDSSAPSSTRLFRCQDHLF